MTQSVQDCSLPSVAPPEPGSDTKTLNLSATEEVARSEESLVDYATSTAAIGYYLSLAMHVIAYAAAALLFAIAGRFLEQEDVVTPIRASLDDFDRNADQPKFVEISSTSLGKSSGESNIQQISNNLSVVENGFVDAFNSELAPSLMKNDDETEDAGNGEFLFKLPESGLAVTKGSFTVWTEPESPNVREPYLIIVEIMLPDDIRSYRVNDLSGYVIGSDDYRQRIPFDTETPNSSFYTNEEQKLVKLSSSERIKVRRNKIQLAIRVPGAAKLVKDTIEIRSRRLRETQKLELIFGK